AWRETGALLGVSAAAVAPTLLGPMGSPYAAFAIGFAVLCLAALLAMRGEWAAPGEAAASAGLREFADVLADPVARRLLFVALANAAPVAVSASLFLFFVEDALMAPAWAGPLLLLFFLAAAGAAPLWAALARRIGTRLALSIGMALAIAAFAPVPWLGPGDVGVFAVICVVSGATLGADLTLLPALFARRMAEVAPGAAAGFGLWAFVTKLTLALAAIVILPALDAAGFVAGGTSPAAALQLLGLLYAGLPCGLKLIALALLWAGPLERQMVES
ncbi:MAG: MFS transporter, partial [Pseudomonadota bacterium]